MRRRSPTNRHLFGVGNRTLYINALLIQSRKLPPLASCDKRAFDAEMLAMGDPSWSAESPRATRPVRVATASGQTTQFGAPYEMGRAPSAIKKSATIDRIRIDQIYYQCRRPDYEQRSSLLLITSSLDPHALELRYRACIRLT